MIGTWMFGTPTAWAGVNKLYFGRVRQLVAERDQWGVSNLKMLCSPDQDSMQDVLDVANSSLFDELTSDVTTAGCGFGSQAAYGNNPNSNARLKKYGFFTISDCPLKSKIMRQHFAFVAVRGIVWAAIVKERLLLNSTYFTGSPHLKPYRQYPGYCQEVAYNCNNSRQV